MRLLSVILTFSYSASAANYYVDFSSGNDGNAGTSTGSAWVHCPGDSLATSVPSGISLASGDCVYFKGGVSYKSTISVNWSGTIANPITYDGNSSGSWGTGRAVFDGENVDSDVRRYGFKSSSIKTNLVFRNLEFQKFGGHSSVTWTCGSLPSAVSGTGIYLVDSSLVTIDNCYFHAMGDWQNAANMSESIMDACGINLFNSASSITVTNCEFTQIPAAGVRIDVRSGSTSTNISVLNSTFHDYIRWGIDLVCNANNCTMKGITIDGITIKNIYQYSPGEWLGCANLWPHFDGIIMRVGGSPYTGQSLGTSTQPIIIRNSWFYNDSSTADDAGTAMIFLTTFGGRVLIYNNQFVNTLSSGFGSIYAQDGIALADTTTQPEYLIYNNTFFDSRNCVTLRTLTASMALTNGVVRIKNNIFDKTDTGSNFQIETGLDNYSAPTELDYNCYLTSRPDSVVSSMIVSGSRTYRTVPQLKSAGLETHGIYSDPLFVNSSYGLGVNSSLNNLRLSSSSSCIGIADNLSSLFTTDFSGTPRFQSWDIGAFEYLKTVSVNAIRAGALRGK